MTVDPRIIDITNRIRERSAPTRELYLARIRAKAKEGPKRSHVACGNLAHAVAGCSFAVDRDRLSDAVTPNLGIITSYNDLLSAHQPFERFPEIIRQAAREVGGTAQVASGVPAMCDGVTQGQTGMELSLFSRDVIAMATAVGLSHDVFDAVVYLGICDKIVPGLAIGALTFGHLPAVFIPAGPMPSGLPNDEKSRIRQLYAEGKVGRAALLDAEMRSYHSPGTCTFYGTANSNQMLMEIMGLHTPGSSFVNPGTPLRDALTREATRRAIAITALGNEFMPVGEMVDERTIVNGVVGLHATGGSTNHTMHLVAIAAAAGIKLTWQDISDLSEITPLLARISPNGLADVNLFQAAGGMGYLIRELLDLGMLHEDVNTVWGTGLRGYAVEVKLSSDGNSVARQPAVIESGNLKVLTTGANPFSSNGGLRVLHGNIGEAVIKVSAVKQEHRIVEAPARVFHNQDDLKIAFEAGTLTGDFIAVVRFQGPKSNGMPELHKLTPMLGVLQDRGQKVALVTDGRMSGASGKVPAAIHVTPEAKDGGPIGRIQDGDMIRLDAEVGTIEILVDDTELTKRAQASPDLTHNEFGLGRELFAIFRHNVGIASRGASVF